MEEMQNLDRENDLIIIPEVTETSTHRTTDVSTQTINTATVCIDECIQTDFDPENHTSDFNSQHEDDFDLDVSFSLSQVDTESESETDCSSDENSTQPSGSIFIAYWSCLSLLF